MTDSAPAMPIASRIELYSNMVLIREVETKLGELFAAGTIPGFIHLSIGQEAVAAGVASVLRKGDTFSTTHRGHGHALANGVDLDRFLLEVLGREGGLCKGRSGSMHVTDMSIGMLGANGIVGAGMPIAVGSALAHQVRRRRSIAVAFFGDGALAEGVAHESLNIARLWRLPVLFVCENNGWSEFSPTDKMLAATPLRLAAAFEIEALSIDGDDVEAVSEAAGQLANATRTGAGPTVLECQTHRHRGHFEGDPQRYRPASEVSSLSMHDPVVFHRARLVARGVEGAELDAVDSEVRSRVTAAVERALEAAAPAGPLPRSAVYAETTSG